MTRSLFVAALAAISFQCWPISTAVRAAESQVVDGIAAIVNGDVITYGQVRTVSAPRERLLASQFKGEELQKQVKTARDLALKDLIDRQLIVQSFAKEKFELPDHFVDQRVDEIIRENFGGDRQTFVKTLQAQNYTLTEFKKQEKERIIVQAMRGKNIK